MTETKLGVAQGWNENYFAKLTAASQLSKDDSGKTLFLNLAAGFTTELPASTSIGAGWHVNMIIGVNPTTAYIITEDTDVDTDILVTNGIAELEVDTEDDGPSNTGHTTLTFVADTAIRGDEISIKFDGTNFFINGHTKADGAVTLA